jgi:phage regulator Rha-like protein
MQDAAWQRVQERLAEAAASRTQPTDVDAALERARRQIEALAQASAELQSTLPQQVGEAVRDGMRAEALPVARQVAEVRGLSNQLIRRFEALEGELAAERSARVEDLALLVDLIRASWQAVDERLARMEPRQADVVHLPQHRSA